MDNVSGERGYASISTPDGKFRIWVPRPTSAGRMNCTCGFALKKHLPFVDAMDALDYIQVEEVRQIDEDFSYMVISCLEKPHECMLKLIDDFPSLMEQYLVNV